jgi:hypothetical protein
MRGSRPQRTARQGGFFFCVLPRIVEKFGDTIWVMRVPSRFLIAMAVVLFVLPVVALAQQQGLVPCTGLNCNLCKLGELIQRIINFLIGLAIPLSAALFAWAGILMLSSAENPGQREKAKKIFRAVFIGLIVALGAWLLVQTVLSMLVRGDFYIGKNWNSLQCSEKRLGTPGNYVSIGAWLQSSIPGLQPSRLGPPVVVPSPVDEGGFIEYGNNFGSGGVDELGFMINSSGDGGWCGAGYTYTESETEYWCQGAGGADDWQEANDWPVSNTSSNGKSTAGISRWTPEIAAACANYQSFGDCAAVTQAFMANECGSGNPNCLSNKGAVGLLQIMPATARGLDPARLGGLSDAEIRNILVNDPAYNVQLGVKELSRLYDKYQGDVAFMAAAYNGGDKANVCGSDCIRICGGGTAWQCTAFPGYNETRKYVPNVVATYNRLR